MQIELKEGRDFEVDRKAGTITFKVAPIKKSRTHISFSPIDGVSSVRMETPFFSGLWFLITSRLTRAR